MKNLLIRGGHHEKTLHSNSCECTLEYCGSGIISGRVLGGEKGIITWKHENQLVNC